MLSTEQRHELGAAGAILLRGAVPARAVAVMRARIWEELAKRGLREHDPRSWPAARPAGLQALTRGPAFDAARSPALRKALDAVFGASGWREPPNWGPPLVSFRDADAWDVPSKTWHLDLAITPESGPRAVRAFVFLTDVAPSGGATVAVAGSHRVLEGLARRAGRTLRSREARQALAACDPWFAELAEAEAPNRVQRFMRAGAVVAGARVRVIELCGRAGDVVLMRAELLHALAPHALPAPRLVLAPFVYRAGAQPAG
jgi:hypothetical protein